jgi:hypothetical protein
MKQRRVSDDDQAWRRLWTREGEAQLDRRVLNLLATQTLSYAPVEPDWFRDFLEDYPPTAPIELSFD